MPSIVSFTATPTTLPAGGGVVTLNWETRNALINLIDGVESWTPKSMTVTANRTFTLTSSNAAGSVMATVDVTISATTNPPPTAPTITNMTVTPSSVTLADGQSAIVAVNALVTGATQLTLDGVPTQLPAARTVSASKSFTLVATNAAGSTSASANVSIIRSNPVPPACVPFGSGPATVTLANNNQATVQAALSAAVAGDIIQLVGGSTGWSSPISASLPADVTIRGAGWNGIDGGGDATTIVDNYGVNATLLVLTVPAGGRLRLSGITFEGGTGVLKNNGAIFFSTAGAGTSQIRIDHCHFNMRTGSWSNMKLMSIGGGIRGVMDSCILDMKELSWIHIVNGRTSGNIEWSEPTNFGSNDFFFIEDNQVNGNTTGAVYNSALMDAHTGGKYVLRFNNLVETGVSQTHPTGHAGDDRGARAHENYGNLCTSSLAKEPNFAMDYNNSGGGMVWGNSANQVFKNMLYLNNVRQSNSIYTQAATPTGWGYNGTTFNGTGSAWDQSAVSATGYRGIDQPGCGQGDLLTGTFPSKINSTTGTIAWPNQALEPIYYWNNAGTIVGGWGGNYLAVLATSRIASDRDYYYLSGATANTTPTSPFNGSTGCGWGTLANRPSSGLTVGTGYFVTDEGSWNTTSANSYGVQQNGASGQLYVATSATTWALAYTPYTYPHPLRTC